MSTYGARPQTSEDSHFREKPNRNGTRNQQSQPEFGKINQSSKQFLMQKIKIGNNQIRNELRRGKGTSVPHNNFLDPRPRIFPNTPIIRPTLPPTQSGAGYEMQFSQNKGDTEVLSRTNNDWLEKERLHEDLMQHQNTINTIKLQNSHLRAQLQHLEKEMQQYQQMIEEVNTNKVNNNQKAGSEGFLQITLKRQVRDLREQNGQLKRQIDEMKQNIKITRLTEIQTEKQAFAQECLRLRQMLEQFSGNRNENSELEGKVQKLEIYVSTLNEENQRLNIDNTEMAGIIKQLEEKCYNIQYNSSNNLQTITKLKSDNQRFQRTVKDLNSEINRLQNQLYASTIKHPTSNQYNYSPNKHPVASTQPYKSVGSHSENTQNHNNDPNEIRQLLDENQHIRKTIEERNKAPHNNTNLNNQGIKQKPHQQPIYKNNTSNNNANVSSKVNNNNSGYHNAGSGAKNNSTTVHEKKNNSNQMGQNNNFVQVEQIDAQYTSLEIKGQLLVSQTPFQKLGQLLVPQHLQKQGVVTFHDIKKILLSPPFSLKDSPDIDVYCQYITDDGNDQFMMFNPDKLSPIPIVQAQFYELMKEYKIFSEKDRGVFDQKLCYEFTEKQSLMKNLLERTANKENQVKYQQLLEVLLKSGIYLKPDESDYLLEQIFTISNGNLKKIKYNQILSEFSVRFATFEQKDSNSNLYQSGNSKGTFTPTLNENNKSNSSSPAQPANQSNNSISQEPAAAAAGAPIKTQDQRQSIQQSQESFKADSQTEDANKKQQEEEEKKQDDDGIYEDQSDNMPISLKKQGSQEGIQKEQIPSHQKENDDSKTGREKDQESSQPDIEEVTEKDQFNEQKTVHVEDQYNSNYQPDEEELLQRIDELGIDKDAEPEFIDVAIMSFQMRIPADWQKNRSSEGSIFYSNLQTEEFSKEHPNIKIFRQFIEEKRLQMQNGEYDEEDGQEGEEGEEGQNGEQDQEEEYYEDGDNPGAEENEGGEQGFEDGNPQTKGEEDNYEGQGGEQGQGNDKFEESYKQPEGARNQDKQDQPTNDNQEEDEEQYEEEYEPEAATKTASNFRKTENPTQTGSADDNEEQYPQQIDQQVTTNNRESKASIKSQRKSNQSEVMEQSDSKGGKVNTKSRNSKQIDEQVIEKNEGVDQNYDVDNEQDYFEGKGDVQRSSNKQDDVQDYFEGKNDIPKNNQDQQDQEEEQYLEQKYENENENEGAKPSQHTEFSRHENQEQEVIEEN